MENKIGSARDPTPFQAAQRKINITPTEFLRVTRG